MAMARAFKALQVGVCIVLAQPYHSKKRGGAGQLSAWRRYGRCIAYWAMTKTMDARRQIQDSSGPLGSWKVEGHWSLTISPF